VIPSTGSLDLSPGLPLTPALSPQAGGGRGPRQREGEGIGDVIVLQ
jgi:hypothetical protein